MLEIYTCKMAIYEPRANNLLLVDKNDNYILFISIT